MIYGLYKRRSFTHPPYWRPRTQHTVTLSSCALRPTIRASLYTVLIGRFVLNSAVLGLYLWRTPREAVQCIQPYRYTAVFTHFTEHIVIYINSALAGPFAQQQSTQFIHSIHLLRPALHRTNPTPSNALNLKGCEVEVSKRSEVEVSSIAYFLKDSRTARCHQPNAEVSSATWLCPPPGHIEVSTV